MSLLMRDGELVSDWRGGGSRSLEIRGWFRDDEQWKWELGCGFDLVNDQGISLKGVGRVLVLGWECAWTGSDLVIGWVVFVG